MTNSTAASGNTLGLAIMGDNRIGMLTPDQIAQMIREGVDFGSGYGIFTSMGFENLTREQVCKPSPPLHGAIDYRRRPDGVWEMPRDRK